MSHYSVAVFEDPNEKSLEELLAPYDENLECPHYISKAELISKSRERVKRYEETTYARYLEDPKAYKEKLGSNQAHFKYVSEEFPQKLHWTDEQHYADSIKYYEAKDIQEDGSVYDTYNPNSKWDWYYVGGRWSCGVISKDDGEVDSELVKNLDLVAMKDFCTYAVVTPDGKWHAPGEMGWFAMSSETEDEWTVWEKQYKERFIDSAKPEWRLSLVDCHI